MVNTEALSSRLVADLPPLEAPQTQRDITTFLSLLVNGDYGQYRISLAVQNDEEFGLLLEAERNLLFSANGSQPHDAPLNAEQQQDVQTLLRLYHCSGSHEKSVWSRIGGGIRSAATSLRSLLA